VLSKLDSAIRFSQVQGMNLIRQYAAVLYTTAKNWMKWPNAARVR